MRSSRRASQGPLYYNNYRMPAKVVRVVMVMIIMMVVIIMMVMVMEAALLQHLQDACQGGGCEEGYSDNDDDNG